MQVIKHAGYLINNKYLTDEDWERALKRWTYRFYNERACAKCEFLEDRHVDDVCGQCKGFLGARCMAKPVTIKGTKYLSLPYGDKVGVRKFLKRWPEFKVLDKHPDVPFSTPINVLGKPYDYQEEAVAALIKHRSGVLDSPPRSGKCQVGNTLVLTPKGLRRIKSLVGEVELNTFAAKQIEVACKEGVTLTDGVYASTSTTIKVTTEAGFSCEGTPEHPMLVKTPEGSLVWKALNTVTQEDSFVVLLDSSSWTQSADLSQDEKTIVEELAGSLLLRHCELPDVVLSNKKAALLLIELLTKQSNSFTLASSKNEQEIQTLLAALGLMSVIT